MKVVGIVASPRKTGNTARLVEEVLSGAMEVGHEAILFYMSEIDISPLNADENGYLYPEDGSFEMMPHLESMGALVLGTPIYYDHVSTRAKLFIDRLYYYCRSHGSEYRERFPENVKFIGVFSYGWNNPNVYGEVVEWLNGRMSHYWDMKIIDSLKAFGTGDKPVKNNLELLQKAKQLGENL